MTDKSSVAIRASLVICLMAALSIISSRLNADTGTCSGQVITLPFDDVSPANVFFCSIAEAFFSGLTNGTTLTTYNPSDPVLREQMAAFVTRTLDQSLRRGHARAALGEWWTNNNSGKRLTTTITGSESDPRYLACDGLTLWVSVTSNDLVVRVDIRTGQVICTLTSIPMPQQIVIVSGNVYIVSNQTPGKIYRVPLSQTTSTSISPSITDLGSNPVGITYDGQNLWTANAGTGPGTGSISRIDVTTSTFTDGFSQPEGILFDGTNLWVTDVDDASLKSVDIDAGTVIQTIPLSGTVGHPVFDGTNLWIPCTNPDQIYVVRGVGGLRGTILAQLTGNGLDGCVQAAFDGERILVPNTGTQTASLWRASDLSPIAVVPVTSQTVITPGGVCSDGTTFFIGLKTPSGSAVSGKIVRF